MFCRMILNCAGRRARTADPFLFREVLYQLSYPSSYWLRSPFTLSRLSIACPRNGCRKRYPATKGTIIMATLMNPQRIAHLAALCILCKIELFSSESLRVRSRSTFYSGLMGENYNRISVFSKFLCYISRVAPIAQRIEHSRPKGEMLVQFQLGASIFNW